MGGVISIMLVNFFINSWLALILRDLAAPARRQRGGPRFIMLVASMEFVIGSLFDYMGPIVLVIM
jgi:hypothetical protein